MAVRSWPRPGWSLLSLTLLGFLLGLALGGTLAGWHNVPIRWWLPVTAALVVQLFPVQPAVRLPALGSGLRPIHLQRVKAVPVIALLMNALGSATPALNNAWLVATAGVALNLLVICGVRRLHAAIRSRACLDPRRHSGVIRVDSQVGRGSSFVVRLAVLPDGQAGEPLALAA